VIPIRENNNIKEYTKGISHFKSINNIKTPIKKYPHLAKAKRTQGKKTTNYVMDFVEKKIGGKEYLKDKLKVYSYFTTGDYVEQPYLQFHLNPSQRTDRHGKAINKSGNTYKKGIKDADMIRIELDLDNKKRTEYGSCQRYNKYNVVLSQYNQKTFEKVDIKVMKGVLADNLKSVLEDGVKFLKNFRKTEGSVADGRETRQRKTLFELNGREFFEKEYEQETVKNVKKQKKPV